MLEKEAIIRPSLVYFVPLVERAISAAAAGSDGRMSARRVKRVAPSGRGVDWRGDTGGNVNRRGYGCLPLRRGGAVSTLLRARMFPLVPG